MQKMNRIFVACPEVDQQFAIENQHDPEGGNNPNWAFFERDHKLNDHPNMNGLVFLVDLFILECFSH